MTEGSKKGSWGGPSAAIAAWLAAGTTLVALGNVLLLVDEGGFPGWRAWLRMAAIAGQGLLAAWFWTLSVRRRRDRGS
ncbi:hypothetical protein [Amycolatopsis sp. lyj-23]|uniref:hypothetical protein n=1 Tax=Amycolatopsis sp. lyj-23 TaxID=2789283 RepID=UPI00397CB386